jgi:hypothetical protein
VNRSNAALCLTILGNSILRALNVKYSIDGEGGVHPKGCNAGKA